MVRLVLGVIVGMIVAVATMAGLDLVTHILHPLPNSLRANDYAGIGAYIRTMPGWALALLALEWFLGALAGGLVAGIISRRSTSVWLVALIVLAAALVNVFKIPHPLVLQIAAVVAPILAALIGLRILRGRVLPSLASAVEAS